MDKVTRQGSVQFNISYEMQLTNSKLSGDKNLSETDECHPLHSLHGLYCRFHRPKTCISRFHA